MYIIHIRSKINFKNQQSECSHALYMFLQNLHIVLKRHKTFPNLVVVHVYIQKRAIKINLSSNLHNVTQNRSRTDGAMQYK